MVQAPHLQGTVLERLGGWVCDRCVEVCVCVCAVWGGVAETSTDWSVGKGCFVFSLAVLLS